MGQEALEVVDTLQQRGVVPDAISYSRVAAAFRPPSRPSLNGFRDADESPEFGVVTPHDSRSRSVAVERLKGLATSIMMRGTNQ